MGPDVLLRRVKDTRREAGEEAEEEGGRDSSAATGQGTPGTVRSWSRRGTVPPWSPQRGRRAGQRLGFRLLAPELDGENNCSGPKTPSLQKVLPAAPAGQGEGARRHREHRRRLSPGPVPRFDHLCSGVSSDSTKRMVPHRARALRTVTSSTHSLVRGHSVPMCGSFKCQIS